MLVFPQLATGVSGQFPIRKRRLARTVVNEAAGGHRVKLADDAAAMIEWQLRFEGLTDGERDEIAQFFTAMEGRLKSFTFLDPADNLLKWSEKLDDAAWERNVLLQVTGGIGDPLGTQRASRLSNISGATLRIEQTVNAPAWFHYAFSVWARSDAPEQLGLVRSITGSTHVATHDVGPGWKRLVLSGAFSDTAESLKFGLEIEAGRAVEVFGLQAEPQLGASGYKKTVSRSGVYPQARFGDDELDVTTEAPDRHSLNLRIVSRA